MISERQGGNEVVRTEVNGLHIGCRGVAAVKNQCNLLAFLGELGETIGERFGDSGEHGGVVLISRIKVREQGYIEVDADKKS